MDIAVSMYLGGKEINASNPKLNTDSYRELGLKCAYCGEPVFHKNGYYNKAHFSHFPSIDPQKYEECLIRQRSAFGFSFSDRSWWENDGRAQRFELFQRHFLYILKSHFPDMEFSLGFDNPHEVDLNDIQSQALTIAAQNSSGTEKYLRIFDSRFTDIETRIIVEVLGYITRSSSRNIFKSFSEYAIKNLLKSKTLAQVEELDSGDLYCEIVNLIGSISWLEILAKITDVDITKIKNEAYASKTKIALKEVNNLTTRKKSCIYFDKSMICIADVERFSLENEIKLAKIDMRRMLSSSWVVQPKRVPISIRQDQALFKTVRRNKSLFSKSAERKLAIKIRDAINAYIEENESWEVLFQHGDLGVICLDELTEEFLKIGESKVFLIRRDLDDESAEEDLDEDIALISINRSSIKYKEYYILNEDCIRLTHDYRRLLIDDNLEVKRAIVKLLEEIYSIFKRNKSRNL